MLDAHEVVVYFRPESVPLAIQMLDDSDFRLGEKGPMGLMRVTEADSSYKSQKDLPLASEQAKKKGTGANRDRTKIIKKNKEMAEYVLSLPVSNFPLAYTNGAYLVASPTGTTMTHHPYRTLQAAGTK